MPNRAHMEKLRHDLQQKKDDLLDRLELNHETWIKLHQQQIEFEERATQERLAAPFAEFDERIVIELQRIEKALQKMETGQYGICETCGLEISLQRLQAVPAAEQCMQCASGKTVAQRDREEEFEQSPQSGTLSDELEGLDDTQLAAQVMDKVRAAGITSPEELTISSENHVVLLGGFLPDEKSHHALLEYLKDTLSIRDIEDHIIIDRILWENRSRNRGTRQYDQRGYEVMTEGRGSTTTGAADSQKSGFPMDPGDTLTPENPEKE